MSSPSADPASQNPNVVWTVADPVPDSVYDSIANQVKNGTPSIDTPASNLVLHMRSRHVIYYHQASGWPKFVNGQIVNWGDCGQPTNSIPPGGLRALSDVSAGLTAAVGGAGAAVAGLGGAAAASAAGLGALNAIPIVGTIAAAALLPLEIIEAHHAQAVAKEQGTLCAWIQQINQWFDAVDQAVQQGQMLPADGIAALQSMQSQFDTGVASVSAACTPGHTNAACDIKGDVDALVLLRTWMYNNLAMFNPAAANAPVTAVAGGGTLTVAPLPAGSALSHSTPVSFLSNPVAPVQAAPTSSATASFSLEGGNSLMLILLLLAAALFL